ncbi:MULTISPECIES: hypothetical protein [unclassified Micromonospora]|uniref:hypothetical protein n=1 Tax=unclassified Micromonospora TaxID=2617518 RepID=UPI0015904396|nr:hypothetical protein [Verrucosispora sp. NA02020]QKW16303.1 hypothetical protein HUT12_28505 [Verrucosispora sp. NA02020]
MIALVRFRLAGFLRTGRALAPVLAGLLVLGILYGGGRAEPAEAYGVSAVVLFPVLAWQTKILLDVEPDAQRRLAVVALGPTREWAAGLLAAATAGLGLIAVALVIPWLLGGMAVPTGPDDRSIVAGLALGLWAHLIALPAAVALGALAGRAVTRSAGYGVAVLVLGVVLALVFGRVDPALRWLAPPLLTTARALAGSLSWATGVLVTAWALGWAAVLLAGCRRARHRRA